MVHWQFLPIVAASTVLAALSASDAKPLVSSESLQENINIDTLMKHAKDLENIAYATPQRNRLVGTKGHNDTVTYLYNQLTAPELNGFYNVSLQAFDVIVQVSASGSLYVNNLNTSKTIAEYSPSGNASAELVVVSNLGCNATDYPGTLAGKIALISRGTCPFLNKSALAGHARAVGAVIYNNIGGPIGSMTLSPDVSPLGPTVPTVGISKELGDELVKRIQGGEHITARLDIKTVLNNTQTFNVLAESVTGNKSSIIMAGAHSDSVAEGPGINDDGSGSIGILSVAKALTNYSITNAVRFAWWSAEEEGLLGSDHYVKNLTSAEQKKIKLYMNFDMIASPNFQYGVFDGDGSAFNMSGPAGSADVEKLFQNYYTSKKLNWTSIEFNGRSDYNGFIQAGIAAGGIATGAEVNKTAEGVAKTGGQAGVAFDINYHGPGDNVTNLNTTAFLVNTKAIAHGVAVFTRGQDTVLLDTATEVTPDSTQQGKKRMVRKSLKVHSIAKQAEKRRLTKIIAPRRFSYKASV